MRSERLAEEWAISFTQQELIGPPPNKVIRQSGGNLMPLHAAFFLGYGSYAPAPVAAQARQYLPALIAQAQANLDVMTGDGFISAIGLRAVHFCCLHADRKPLKIFIDAFGCHPEVMAACTDPLETYGCALPPVLLYLISGKDMDASFWRRAFRPPAGQPNTISKEMFERAKELYK